MIRPPMANTSIQERHAQACLSYILDKVEIIFNSDLGHGRYYTKFRTPKGKIISIYTCEHVQVVRRNGIIVSSTATQKTLPARKNVINQKQ